MKVLRDADEQTISNSVVTIGAFDGVHLGHQAVIAQVRSRAGERHAESVVVTFDTHPALVVRPESAPKLLTTLDHKLETIESLGVDAVYLIEFDTDRASTRALTFVEEVFVARLGAKEIVVGNDFHFGKGREGTVEFLRTQGAAHGFDVDGLELLKQRTDFADPVSSTAIRRVLVGGDVESAASMLGRSFEVRGTVIRGDQRGRQIGFPTANIVLPDEMAKPANGVYACEYETADGTVYAAAVNVGVRPTFYESATAAVIEAHLLDFSGDLYDSEAKIRFVKFLRSERRFDGIDELKAQLDIDTQTTRSLITP